MMSLKLISWSSSFLDFNNFLSNFIFFLWTLAINLFFCSVFLIFMSYILWAFLSVMSFSRYIIACFTNSRPYLCTFLISFSFFDHSLSYWSSINFLLRLKLASSEMGGSAFSNHVLYLLSSILSSTSTVAGRPFPYVRCLRVKTSGFYP